tara:strand:+ start:188 stop:454 length:267 start_codon:yes stop_codon:yes gene_type:complete
MIYKQTIKDSRDKNNTLYGIGRKDSMHGKQPDEGGYAVWVRRGNYSGSAKGGIAYTWRKVKGDLGYVEAVKLMNKRLKRKEFVEELPK